MLETCWKHDKFRWTLPLPGEELLLFFIAGQCLASYGKAGGPHDGEFAPAVTKRSNRLITAHSPVDGLNRRNLSFLPVFAQAVAAVAPAGAMSVIPALVLGATGPNLVLSFVIAMVVMLLVSFCLRPMTKRMAAVSGLYSYTAKGLGPMPAITAGWSAIFGYGLVATACLLSVGTYAGQLAINIGIPVSDPRALTMGVMLAAAAAASFLMVRGIKVSARVTLLVECISIAILAVLMTTYFVLVAPDIDVGHVFLGDGRFDSLSVGIVVAVSAFVGFESPTTLGGEAYRPFVSVTRAVTWTPVVTGVLYLLAVTAQDIALREAPPSIAASSTPLSDLFSHTSPALAAVLDLGIAASFFACTIASVNALARTLFCMGREGVAPRLVGKTHPVFRTPWTAILTVMPIITLVPIAIVTSGVKPEQGLVSLFTLGAYGYLGSYVLASASLPFFLRKIGEGTKTSWILGALTSLAIGLVLWNAAVVSVQTGSLQAYIYGAIVLASIVFTVLVRQFAPRRLARVGIYDETRESDLFDARRAP